MKILDQIHVGAGTTIGPLTLFPVWADTKPVAAFDLPNDGNLRVGELPAPSVPYLTVENLGGIELLIPEGTILEGGLQTRIAASDYLIRAGASTQIGVRCVERGRWGGAQREHKTDGRAPSHVVSSLRKTLRADGFSPDSQQEVWESVTRLESRFGSKPSSSLNDIMADEGLSERKQRMHDAQRQRREAEDRFVTEDILVQLEDFARRPLKGQQGVIIGIAGEPVFFELYATPKAFSEQFWSIVKAHCLDAALAQWKPTSGAKARSFADAITKTQLEVIDKAEIVESARGLSEDIDLRAIFRSDFSESPLRASAINRKHLVTA